jgi:pimeloyl-ACP methyl ester carboxylesterase
MKLYHRELGQGQPIILLHGIFGSSDNWLTQARLLSSAYHTYAVDLRNHGQSPHDDAFDYPAMVADLLEFMDGNNIKDPVLIGHSMGGKVVMNFAVANPDKVQKLIVVDIAPRPYNLDNYVILDGLKAIPIDTVSTRNEADEILARFVGEPDVRQFLLKNLQRKAAGGFKWKLNLTGIDVNIKNIGLDIQIPGKFEKPTLFVRGGRSEYVRDKDITRIKEIFPSAELETLDTGHWVPAEKPKEFVDIVSNWLSKT